MPELKPWEAEQPVNAELARVLIEAQFPHLAPAEVAPLGDGWDNTAFRVNKTLVFRFPRREVAVPLARTETRVLPFIEGRLPVATPRLTHVGEPGDGFPWLWVGYPHIPGRIMTEADLNDTQREAFACRLGVCLRALHDIPTATARRLGIPGDEHGRFDLEARIGQFNERLDEAVSKGLIEATGACRAVVDAVDRAWTPTGDTLVHGDMHSSQLLVDDTNSLAGIIDWGDAHLGDPGQDIAGALMILPPGARDAFFDSYGPVDPARLRAALFRGMHVAVAVLLYAVEIDDGALATEARLAIRNVTLNV